MVSLTRVISPEQTLTPEQWLAHFSGKFSGEDLALLQGALELAPTYYPKDAKTQMGEPDAQGRRRAEIIPGSEEVIACDAVIVAFGFAPHAMPWLESVGVTTDNRGRIEARGQYKQQTANPKIFAGGDITRGSDLVVTAIAEGRDAAEGILDYLDI